MFGYYNPLPLTTTITLTYQRNCPSLSLWEPLFHLLHKLQFTSNILCWFSCHNLFCFEQNNEHGYYKDITTADRLRFREIRWAESGLGFKPLTDSVTLDKLLNLFETQFLVLESWIMVSSIRVYCMDFTR